jgi:exopolyphosphatase/guanosine-5'-triphosphate,3'-diphosphate pyrophosphatase
MEYNTLGAVDLGSNSFHLLVGRVVDDQIFPLDSLKETVRLASGLTEDRRLDDRAQERALAALKRFSERLAGMPPEAVRVVGTNALRVAKNSADFLRRAEKTLGFPIEVIPGREEARLIYLGVVHSLPMEGYNRLVIDIGGGSTEFIIGNRLKPKLMDSLYMGCVSYTGRYFGDGRIDKRAFKVAELAAREQVQTLSARFQREGWREAVGSSGTARSIADVLQRNGRSDGHIDAAGIAWLREQLIAAGDLRRIAIQGLREDRIPVVAGGVAIMSAAFAELELRQMTVAEGALRQGVLWDLLGRAHHRDIRDLSIEQFARRYHIDLAQAQRVTALAQSLMAQLVHDDTGLEAVQHFLDWAGRLHEIGISIAQGAYHKHSAYILANADMPGFSRQEQAWLSNLVLAQRGKLAKMRAAFEADERLAALAFCLRVAVIFYRSRRSLRLPPLRVSCRARVFTLNVDPAWLEDHTLIGLALEAERAQWASLGFQLNL